MGEKKRAGFYLLTGLCAGFLMAFTVSYVVDTSKIQSQTIEAAELIIGIDFTRTERDSMLKQAREHLEDYQQIRKMEITNDVPLALNFDPVPSGKDIEKESQPNQWNIPKDVQLPENKEDLAFYNVTELASLIKQRKISSVELTKLFLNRLQKHAPTLEAVITYTEERALRQARRMDRELADGEYRGPLHGIPYGIKDLFALEGYKTTWGAEPFKDQYIDRTATVIKQLDQAGAVLIAKLTLGALAYGDIWFGGKTRNPWNLKEGSSGSSAGSAAATAAGLIPFSIGTETYGSIVSPSNRCGTTGLRPTFGRVSRFGAMALSWSMDKIGPITRSVQDAALVFNEIHGPDGHDQTVKNLPFNYQGKIDLKEIKIGYYKSAFEADYDNKENDQRTLDKLRGMGVELVPIELPDFPVSRLRFILTAEAAAAFDNLTRTDRDTLLSWQENVAWPNTFRAARFIPAVEYIQANRAREILIHKMDSVMQKVDLYVAPTFGGSKLLANNLTGYPAVVLPNGFNNNNEPGSITFVGQLYDEGKLLGAAQAYQEATEYHNRHPKRFVP